MASPAADRRRPLSEAELRAVATAIDPGSRPLGSEPLLGGLDWGTYLIHLETTRGARSVVLRRHDGAGDRPLASARRLWATLRALARVDLPVPRPLIFDEGGLIGAPIVAMTACPGRISPPPKEAERWLRSYAGALHRIQAVELDRVADLPSCPDPSTEVDRLVGICAGRETPEWGDLIDLLRATAATSAPADRVLRHRDVWFGNLLWADGEVSAILDWSGACVGDPAGDVAYARLDVHLVLGADAAASFQRLMDRDRGERPTAAWWELWAAADGTAWLDEWVKGYREVGVDLDHDAARRRLKEFTEHARSRLGARSPRTSRP